MRNNITWIAFVLLSVSNFNLSANSDWDVSMDVAYKRSYDIQMIELMDGSELSVYYNDKQLRKEMQKWRHGKVLLVKYDIRSGNVLYDPVSNRSIPILNAFGKIYNQENNPIDVLEGECIEKNQSTLGISACLSESGKHWERELNRRYSMLHNDKRSKGIENNLKEMYLKWSQYRDSMIDLVTRFYGRHGGTVWGIVIRQKLNNLTKSQANVLGSLLGGM